MKTAVFWQPHPRQTWGLAALLILSAAPHLLRLPFTLTGLWLLAVGWRLNRMLNGPARISHHPTTATNGGEKCGLALPPRLLRLTLTLATGIALYQQFGTLLGREAGSALLVMMTGLKFLELKQRRDALVLVLLAYLLVAVQFLFSRAPLSAGYAVIATLLITAAWIRLERPAGVGSWRKDLALAARLLAQAAPLMLILFVLFPRLPGPLWSLPSDAHARTGLSGDMEPGRISELALSGAVAFRADFAGPIPPSVQRYWRGPVFEFTDGRRWWGADEETAAHDAATTVQTRGTAYRYTLTLEPSGTPWLPALEMSTSLPADVIRLASLEMRARHNVDTLRRDTFVAFTNYRVHSADATALMRNLEVPAMLSARVRELAQSWRVTARNERAVVDAALRHFNTENFVYTLTPPRLGRDPADAFLFETRRGFCEHYASAFTLLMRAAGIPARVVTGYQGGEMNPLGGHLIVRQSDAHAWAEVWLKDAGWVRVDPTAAVAPERIEYRIDLGFARAEGGVRFQLGDDNAFVQAWRRARFLLDALDNGWNQWVLSYGPERQRDLFAKLGLRDMDWRELAWALLICAGASIVVLSLLLLRRPQPAVDEAARQYARFRRTLAQHGFLAAAHEGPRTLLHHIERMHPGSAADARHIIELYIALRYSAHPDAATLLQLRRSVAAFKLR